MTTIRHLPLCGSHVSVCGPIPATAFGAPRERRAARDWLAASWSLVHPHGAGGVFPNFPDPDLPDPSHAYHRENLERLMEVKALYDPDDVFRLPQSIPAAGGP